MSKLSEQMRRASRAESRPVGFTTTATAAQPTMLVVAEVSAKDGATAAQSADALLLDDADEAAIKAAVAAAVPVGVRLGKGDRARVAALGDAGVDFVVLSEESAASALMVEGVSYILEIAGEPTDTDLRALEALPLEALLAPEVDGALTLRRSIGLRRFVAFARKPLMLPVSADTDAADLEALRELNVLLLLAPASGAAALRERIAALPPRRTRRVDRGVGIPSFGLASSRIEAPEEDDDHDHDHE